MHTVVYLNVKQVKTPHLYVDNIKNTLKKEFYQAGLDANLVPIQLDEYGSKMAHAAMPYSARKYNEEVVARLGTYCNNRLFDTLNTDLERFYCTINSELENDSTCSLIFIHNQFCVPEDMIELVEQTSDVHTLVLTSVSDTDADRGVFSIHDQNLESDIAHMCLCLFLADNPLYKSKTKAAQNE